MRDYGAMSVDVIPAGERGEFRITDRMLMETGATSWAAFEILLQDEATSRGLDIELLKESPSLDVIVRWRPTDPSPGGP